MSKLVLLEVQWVMIARLKRLIKETAGILGLACVFVIFNLSAKSKEIQSNLANTCRLTFGWDMVKPFQYIDENGQVVGLQIELTEAILAELGCSVNYKQAEWNELISMLKTGEIDFMADATITPERLAFSMFSDSYRQETFTLYVQKENYNKHLGKSIVQLAEQGFKFGLTKGFVYSDEIEAMRHSSKYQTNFVYSNSNFDNYTLLKNSKIDGFIEDAMVAGYTLRKSVLQNLIVGLPGEVHRGDISYMFSKTRVSPELVKRFNTVLAKVKTSESYKRTWLLDFSN